VEQLVIVSSICTIGLAGLVIPAQKTSLGFTPDVFCGGNHPIILLSLLQDFSLGMLVGVLYLH